MKVFRILLAASVLGGFVWISCQIDFQKKSFQVGCPFCQEKVLKTQEFYQKEGAIGLLIHKPAVPGHVLIIPKRHVVRFEELEAEEIAAIGAAIQAIDPAIRSLYGTTGYVLLQKNSREAGQSVPHVHFHYLPRSDRLGQVSFIARFFLSPYLKPLSEGEMKVRAAQLHELLDSSALD